MEINRPRLLPDTGLSRAEMKSLQREVADCALFRDDLSIGDESAIETATVAGIDQAFDGDTVVSAAVLVRDGEVLERTVARVETEMPYMPGLLSFREAPGALAALRALDRDPAVVLVDGSGRIHPREAGGTPERSLDSPLPAGTRIPIAADDSVTAPDGTTIGHAVQTRQFDSEHRHVNPVYASPGHRVSAATAAEVVERTTAGYKLPEPIRLADRHAGRRS
ncbi:endonuclease V [Halobacteriales archaeon QH_10_67_13]|nr:MAG: endonuclease V [Halobacteriales archaeon QH_10_67_13]